MASALAPPPLLDLAWAVVTVQLMIITFWTSSEHFRQRLYGSPSPPPPALLVDDSNAVVLKKRRRLLQPKSVWDADQVKLQPPSNTALCQCALPTVDAGFRRIRARRSEADVGERAAHVHCKTPSMQQLDRRSSCQSPLYATLYFSHELCMRLHVFFTRIVYAFARVPSLIATQLPKAAVAVLEREFVMFTSKVTNRSVSGDGETVRRLFSHCKIVNTMHR
jgi:hypothetical protein